MVGRAGIGPATLGLKGPCSTTELPTHKPEMRGNDNKKGLPVQGIALWEAKIYHDFV